MLIMTLLNDVQDTNITNVFNDNGIEAGKHNSYLQAFLLTFLGTEVNLTILHFH